MGDIFSECWKPESALRKGKNSERRKQVIIGENVDVEHAGHVSSLDFWRKTWRGFFGLLLLVLLFWGGAFNLGGAPPTSNVLSGEKNWYGKINKYYQMGGDLLIECPISFQLPRSCTRKKNCNAMASEWTKVSANMASGGCKKWVDSTKSRVKCQIKWPPSPAMRNP